MKRFLLGISALLLTAVMGFAEPSLRPATYRSGDAPRLEQVRHRRHKQKRYKNHYKKNRHHKDYGRYGA
jgi:hypothetical protein